MPGPICESGYQVMDYIKHIDTRFDKEQVRSFKEKYMSACDGHSTERIIKLTMGDTLEEMKK